MKSYHINLFKNVSGIVTREETILQPGDNEVLIRIKAVSINRRDIFILNQTYPLSAKQDVIPLSDGAGEIVATGKNVTRFAKGDKVIANYFPKWRDGKMGYDVVDQLGCTMDGMLTEYAVVHEDALVKFPYFLSWEEASTLPCAGLVAWSSLMGSNPIKPGNTVLTIGSGGVALFVIQFANLMGAKVIALTSDDDKIEKLKSLGATHVLNYRKDSDWDKTILELTNGYGIDRVVETGGTDTIEKSIDASAMGGEIILLSPFGTINDIQPKELKYVLSNLFVRLVTLRPVFVGSRLSMEDMCRAIDINQLHPVIDKVFEFDKAQEAYHYFIEGRQMGKVIIKGLTNN